MTVVEQEERIRKCPKCGSKLWNVVEYSAVTGLFHLLCSDCKYTEIKEWGLYKSDRKIKNELFY